MIEPHLACTPGPGDTCMGTEAEPPVRALLLSSRIVTTTSGDGTEAIGKVSVPGVKGISRVASIASLQTSWPCVAGFNLIKLDLIFALSMPMDTEKQKLNRLPPSQLTACLSHESFPCVLASSGLSICFSKLEKTENQEYKPWLYSILNTRHSIQRHGEGRVTCWHLVVNVYPSSSILEYIHYHQPNANTNHAYENGVLKWDDRWPLGPTQDP